MVRGETRSDDITNEVRGTDILKNTNTRSYTYVVTYVSLNYTIYLISISTAI